MQIVQFLVASRSPRRDALDVDPIPPHPTPRTSEAKSFFQNRLVLAPFGCPHYPPTETDRHGEVLPRNSNSFKSPGLASIRPRKNAAPSSPAASRMERSGIGSAAPFPTAAPACRRTRMNAVNRGAKRNRDRPTLFAGGRDSDCHTGQAARPTSNGRPIEMFGAGWLASPLDLGIWTFFRV